MYISIGEYQFELSAPYESGHTLTLGEAQALNSLRAERIRDTLRRSYPGGLVEASELTRLRLQAQQLDQGFAFLPTKARQHTSEFEQLVRVEALAEARALCTSDEEASALALTLRNSPKVLSRVNAILEARQDAARKAFEELLG